MQTLGPSEAYKERGKNPASEQRCDFCAACFVYNCDGSTAAHHDIHFDERYYLEEINAKDDEDP